MAKSVKPDVTVAVFAAALGLAGQAQATINVEWANFTWNTSTTRSGGGGGSGTIALAFGPNQIKLSNYSFAWNICDQHEDECAGLKYAGAVVDARWSINFSTHAIDNNFRAFEGSDLGAAYEDHWMEIVLTSDRVMKVFARDRASVRPSADCYDCGSGLAASASTWQDGDRWWAVIDSYGSSSVSLGEHSLAEQFNVRIAEVPEPQSWAMMIAGFGLMGVALRRRQALTTG